MSLLKWYVDLTGKIVPELLLITEDSLKDDKWRASNYFDAKAYDIISDYNDEESTYDGEEVQYENGYMIDSQIICYFWDTAISTTGSFIAAQDLLEEQLEAYGSSE